MGDLIYYSNHLHNISKSPNQKWREEQQAFIDGAYENTTVLKTDVFEEGYPFDFKFIYNPQCWVGTVIDVTTGMIKDSDDYRSLYFKDINHEVGRGRYFKWHDNYWIVYETTTPELETISTCNIRRCNNWLKWLTNKGEVVQYPCVIEGELTSANSQVAKTITQANSHINVIVQGNKDTLSLIKNSRVMFNHSVYKFSAINNYMQTDYVDENTPLLFMDFYLDMEINSDNVKDNLADDLRQDYTVECNVNQITSKSNTSGKIIPKVYHKNQEVSNPRMEYFSSNTDIIEILEDGCYYLKEDGEAVVNVRILGNDKSMISIPVTVEENTIVSYNIVVNPIVQYIRQGLSVKLSAKIVDNLNNEINDIITLTPSGTDNHNNYSIIDKGDNSWVITNQLISKIPLTLTFSNATYNVEYTINVQLKPMF